MKGGVGLDKIVKIKACEAPWCIQIFDEKKWREATEKEQKLMKKSFEKHFIFFGFCPACRG